MTVSEGASPSPKGGWAGSPPLNPPLVMRELNISGVPCINYTSWTPRAYCILQTETGSDQTLRTGFETVYCMKPRWWESS